MRTTIEIHETLERLEARLEVIGGRTSRAREGKVFLLVSPGPPDDRRRHVVTLGCGIPPRRAVQEVALAILDDARRRVLRTARTNRLGQARVELDDGTAYRLRLVTRVRTLQDVEALRLLGDPQARALLRATLGGARSVGVRLRRAIEAALETMESGSVLEVRLSIPSAVGFGTGEEGNEKEDKDRDKGAQEERTIKKKGTTRRETPGTENGRSEKGSTEKGTTEKGTTEKECDAVVFVRFRYRMAAGFSTRGGWNVFEGGAKGLRVKVIVRTAELQVQVTLDPRIRETARVAGHAGGRVVRCEIVVDDDVHRAFYLGLVPDGAKVFGQALVPLAEVSQGEQAAAAEPVCRVRPLRREDLAREAQERPQALREDIRGCMAFSLGVSSAVLGALLQDLGLSDEY